MTPDGRQDDVVERALKAGEVSMDGYAVADITGPVDDRRKRDPVTISLDELDALPPKQYWFSGLFGPGDVALLYGAPGSGKSFLVAHMIAAACSGTAFGPFHFTGGKALRVLYVATEGQSGLPDRFKALDLAGQLSGRDRSNLQLFLSPVTITGEGDEYTFALAEAVKAAKAKLGGVDLVVVDTLNGATPGIDENDSGAMAQVFAAIKQLQASDQHLSVWLVHHARKDGDSYRGSSVLEASPDLILKVVKGGGDQTRTVSCVKAKNTAEFKPATFILDVVDVEPGRTSCTVDWCEQARPQSPNHRIWEALVFEWERNEHPTVASVKLYTGFGDKLVRNRLDELRNQGVINVVQLSGRGQKYGYERVDLGEDQ